MNYSLSPAARLAAIAVLAVLPLVLSSSPASAHPVHATLAEVEWNQESRVYEVALQVQVADLENAVRADDKGRGSKLPLFVLTREPTSTKRALAFVGQHFFATSSSGSIEVGIVGVDVGVRDAWLYFTWRVSGGEGTGGRASVIHSDLFLGSSPRHANTVVVTTRFKTTDASGFAEKKRVSHVFTQKRRRSWDFAAELASLPKSP